MDKRKIHEIAQDLADSWDMHKEMVINELLWRNPTELSSRLVAEVALILSRRDNRNIVDEFLDNIYAPH